MPATHDPLLERITIDSDVRFGKPCIRGHRITVQELLEWLSTGASQRRLIGGGRQSLQGMKLLRRKPAEAASIIARSCHS
jgi:hypothetical protein